MPAEHDDRNDHCDDDGRDVDDERDAVGRQCVRRRVHTDRSRLSEPGPGTPIVERPLAGLLTSNRESEQGPARYSEMILYVRRLSDEEEGAE